MLKRIVGVASAAIIVITNIAFAQVDVIDNVSRPRNNKVSTDDKEVFRTISRFIHGLRTGVPGLTRSVYYISNNGISVIENGEASERFVNSIDISSGRPVVQIIKPRISWDGSRAVVTCTMLWDVLFINTQRFKWGSRERFVLERHRDKYVIVDAEITPIVLRSATNRELFKKLIRQRIISSPQKVAK